jgi:hypothetical protein
MRRSLVYWSINSYLLERWRDTNAEEALIHVICALVM